jgi:hypothetical protein
VVWNHYVQERDTVGLVAGLSGGGYIFPHAMGEEQLNVYLENAERYMREAGLRVVHATLDDHNWNMALAAQFAEGLAGAGHLGSIVGYGGSPGRSQIEYFGQPVPSVWPSYVLGEENAEVIAEDLLARRGGVELIDVNDQYLSPGTASQPDEGSLNEAAALIPGSFATAESCCLAVAIPVSLQPGNHTLTFRMKVPAKNSGGGIANIYVGSQGDDWQNLAGQSVTVSDFSQTDVYQDFSFAFEVTEPITTGQIRLDYLNTTTALVVDTVRLVNEDSAIPVFALIRINWGNDVSRSPGQFAAGFEAGGGVLLTMEEFMAALNPEYMIELAQTMLASDDPLLLRAQEEFDRGEFAASLISVRRALGEAID